MIKWFQNNKNAIVRNSFLFPILLVVVMSISHVVSWYDLGNPWAWAVYLSVAIEIFALASVSASTIKMNRGSIWFLFGLVTFIQIMGNVFFEFQEIDQNGAGFLAWVQLIEPAFYDWDLLDHRRLLALIQGGTIPMMSLVALHYYIKFGDNEKEKEEVIIPIEEPKEIVQEFDPVDAVAEIEKVLEEKLEEPIIEEVTEEPKTDRQEKIEEINQKVEEVLQEPESTMMIQPDEETPKPEAEPVRRSRDVDPLTGRLKIIPNENGDS